jgi:hypothetical protein
MAEDRHALKLAGLVIGYDLERRRTGHLLGEVLGLLQGAAFSLRRFLRAGRRRFRCTSNGCTM